MKKIIFQTDPIDLSKMLQEFGTEADGAVVTFIGRARNHTAGKKVTHLEYEIYNDMAESEMDKLVSYAIEKWSISECLVIHRHGRVNTGEATILISVSSSHRDEAYQASRYIIDTIKKTVPIWKKEFYSDGSKWVGQGS